MKRTILAAVALCLIAAAAPAAQFGPSQYAIHADDGAEMTNFDLPPALLAQMKLLSGQVTVGNKDGDVTLYEFSDLNCPYCREAFDDIEALLKSDKKLKLVFMPYPVLSVASVQGALVEVTVAKMLSSEQFLDFHRRIYAGRGVVDGTKALSVAQDMGLDGKKIVALGNTKETLDLLKQNADFGKAAKLIATPDYVINGVAILGHPGLKPLQDVVAAVRKCGKVVCG